MPRRFYLTTAIDYVNSRPHLGTAYEKITADVLARYHRLRGRETLFVMGNDEHSQNVYRRARELNLEPLAYCDRMEQEFRAVWQQLDISFDDFIRTTEPRHRTAVETIVRRMAEAGDLYEGFYEGWYCVSCEAFKQEKDLIDGECPIHRTRPEWIREKNHFFRLSRYTDGLRRHFDEHPDFLLPAIRRNEILRLLDAGLEDISISRAGQAWGIPLPFDPSSVVYVWIDALVNYVSAVGFGQDGQKFERWWPADLHVIGKDITRFHCVVWPAMLMSAGLALPRQVFGHGWVHFKGQKMSKSLGTVLDPLEAAGRFGPDPLRLYLVKEIAYGSDGDFTWERFEERYNVDLANNLGNLVSRVAAMANRYRQGRLAPSSGSGRVADVAAGAVRAYQDAMESYALHEAVAVAYRLIDATNEYIAETEPWVLARQQEHASRLDRVLSDAAESVRIAALLLLPIMPRSCEEILRRVGGTQSVEDLRLPDAAAWTTGRERILAKADAMWPRLEPSGTAGAAAVHGPEAKERGRMAEESRPEIPRSPAAPARQAAPAGAPADARLSIEAFMNVDLRAAKILQAERVPSSKKLIKLEVDLGSEQRTLVAGIADAYEPEALVGRSVVIVANLQAIKLMGIESDGMVLAASPEGDRPILVTFDEPPAPGTRVR